ncbi:MAG: glycosyltransferase family 4 protein [Prevotella sp.]|nr:glycosyltransferase family 4 protein [Prevotella sp.]
MHILEIPSFFYPYGGLFCLDQAKALSALGHEVRILSNVQLGVTIGWKDFLALPWRRYEHVMDGITVYQSYQRGIPRVIRPNVNRWVSIVRSMYEDYVAKYGTPDILHAHCAKWAGYAAMKISEDYHIPYVITEHLSLLIFEGEFGPVPSKAWQIPLLKKAYNKANLVVPVSKELVGSLSCYFGTDYRWQAISNIINTDFFHYQQRPSIQNRSFRFCCLANYWSLKGYDILFDAFRRLRTMGVKAELHIAGRGTDSPACRQQLSEGMFTHGLLDKSGVRNLLYQCDALVLASRSEVQPLVLLEAMSTGIPVISTECIPQNLRIKDGCHIVPIDDANALALAMENMINNPMPDGESLSAEVRQMASPQVIGKQLENVFNDILASR